MKDACLKPVDLYICLSIYLSIYLSSYLSVYIYYLRTYTYNYVQSHVHYVDFARVCVDICCFHVDLVAVCCGNRFLRDFIEGARIFEAGTTAACSGQGALCKLLPSLAHGEQVTTRPQQSSNPIPSFAHKAWSSFAGSQHSSSQWLMLRSKKIYGAWRRAPGDRLPGPDLGSCSQEHAQRPNPRDAGLSTS